MQSLITLYQCMFCLNVCHLLLRDWAIHGVKLDIFMYSKMYSTNVIAVLWFITFIWFHILQLSCFQPYTGIEDVHDEEKPVILVTTPQATTTVKKCAGNLKTCLIFLLNEYDIAVDIMTDDFNHHISTVNSSTK